MTLPTVDEIISIHSKLIQRTGDSDVLRDRGLLESAVYSVYNAFDDVEQYPSIQEKAARFALAIVSNYAFIVGDARVEICRMM